MSFTLPERWPDRFPLPDGTQMVVDESGGGVMRVSFLSATGSDVQAFFDRALSLSGWTILSIDRTDGSVEIEGHGYFGEIEVDAVGFGFTVQLVD